MLALPWLWWSYLSMQFVGIPSETLYWILLAVWPISGLVVFYPRTEELLARCFTGSVRRLLWRCSGYARRGGRCAPRPGSTRTVSECGTMSDSADTSGKHRCRVELEPRPRRSEDRCRREHSTGGASDRWRQTHMVDAKALAPVLERFFRP